MLKKIFISLYRFVWYTSAVIIITTALLVTAARLMLPEIGLYKDEIQSWISQYMGYPVTIGAINANWQGWAPQLYLQNIDLFTQDDGKLITKFDSAHLSIDLFTLFLQGEVVPDYLSVTGLSLAFMRNHDGSISISSEEQNRMGGSTENNTAFSEWLLKQKHIVVDDALVSWQDKKNNKLPVKFPNVLLELKTHQKRIQLNAAIKLPTEYGNQLNLNIDIEGNPLKPDWQGNVFAEAIQLNLGHLLQDAPISLIGGEANIKLWTSWKNAKLTNFDGTLDYASFSLKKDSYELPVNKVEMDFIGQRENDKGWLLDSKLEKLVTKGTLWPASTHQIRISQDDAYNFNLRSSYLNLGDILPFLPKGNAIATYLPAALSETRISGHLNDFALDYKPAATGSKQLTLTTDFNGLNIENLQKTNGIENLSGEMIINQDKLKLALDSSDANIIATSMYENEIRLDKFISEVELDFLDEPELTISKLNLVSGDLNLKGSGRVNIAETANFVDIVMHADSMSVESAHRFLPLTMKPELREWLTQALIGGQVTSGDLIYRGNSNDFPFVAAEGKFKAILNIENATFEFQPDWPPIDNLNAEVILENDALFVNSSYGRMFDAEIKHLAATVANLTEKDRNILIDGNLAGHTNDARLVILQSPLKNNQTLEKIAKNNLAGAIDLQLKLDIPLGEDKTAVEGDIKFNNAVYESSLSELDLEAITGNLHFTRSSITSEKLDAKYFGKPVSLSIAPSDSNPENIKLTMSGIADKKFIANQLNSFFPSLSGISKNIDLYVDGESKWELSIEQDESVEDGKLITLYSDLDNVVINLPHPLGKQFSEKRPLSIRTRLDNNVIGKLEIEYNNEVFTDLIIDNRHDVIIKNILIGLGEKYKSEPENEISIEGQLDYLDMAQWIEFINLHKVANTLSQTNKHDRSLSAKINIKDMLLLDNHFPSINLDLQTGQTGWKMQLDSPDLKGQAQLLPSAVHDRLNINLEHLAIQDREKTEARKSIDITNFPELDVNIANTVYEHDELGKAKLITRNVENGISIDKFSLEKPTSTLESTGLWTRIDDIDRSDFSFKLESDSVSNMLKLFGNENTNIDKGKTSINLSANWMDTPMNFAIAKVNGELDMKIGKGQFLDINHSTGRLFGLLSLQALPRRLSLDFSDLFSEGFAFDSIEGNFNLQQGHAYTNNLEMKGSAADIVVSGRTGLTTEDYDQIATVTPKVSNSLPVASALLGPVGIGIGTVIFIAGEIFESIPDQINKILRYQYSITGSWENPDVEKIKEEKAVIN